MFGSVGFPELILIFIVALLLFGPRKLPEIGKSIGRAMGEFKRASNDLQRTLEEEVALDEVRKVKTEVQEAIAAPVGAPSDATPAVAAPAGEGAATGVDTSADPVAPAAKPTEPR